MLNTNTYILHIVIIYVPMSILYCPSWHTNLRLNSLLHYINNVLFILVKTVMSLHVYSNWINIMISPEIIIFNWEINYYFICNDL